MEFTEVFEELREYARIIRNEKTTSANTALRIGDMYLSIIDAMEQVSKRNDLFSLRTGDNGSQYIHTPYALASDSTLSSLGVGSDGTGGVSYDRLDSWDSYTDDKAGYVLSAALGWDLKIRLDNLDLGDFDLSGYLTKSEASGTYATIESLTSFSTRVDVAEDNIDALGLKVQSVESNYVKKGGDTMTGQLGFSGTTYPNIYGNGKHLTLGIKSNSPNFLVITNTVVQPNATSTGMYLGSTDTRWSNVYSVKGDFASSEAGIIKIKRTITSGGAFIDYYHANQDTDYWRVGAGYNGIFTFAYNNKEIGLKVNTSGQLVSEKATGTAPFVVASTTKVANLNADLLDGVSINQIIHYNGNDGNTEDLMGNRIIRVAGKLETGGDIYVYGDILQWSGSGHSYSPSTQNDGNFYHQLYSTTTSKLYYRNKVSSKAWSSWKTIAFTNSDITGNAATATQLKEPVTLWGQSFDGSSNVSGDLTDVGNITPSASATYDLGSTSARWKGIYGNTLDLTGAIKLNNNAGIYWKNTDGTEAAFLHLNTNNDFHLGNSDYGSYLSGKFVGLRYGASKTVGLALTEDGNVGINTATPAYRLDVNGTFHASGDAAIGGTLNVTGVATFRNDILYNSSDATLKIYDIDVDSNDFGNEAVAIQTCFDAKNPETSNYTTQYEYRCNLFLQPRGGQVYVGYTPTGNQQTYALNVGQAVRLYGDANSTNAPEISFYRYEKSSWKIINNSGSLYLQNNYTTAVKSSYFNVLTLAYNTGNATLKGSLTAGSHILPSTDGGGNLGSASAKWSNAYINTVRATKLFIGDAEIYCDADGVLRTNASFASDKTVSSLGVGSDEGSGDIGGIIDLTNVVSNIVTEGSYTIGTEGSPWSKIYATNLYLGDVEIGSTIDSLQSNLGTATSNIQDLTNALSSVTSRVGVLETVKHYSLTIKNSAGTTQLTYNPTSASGSITLTKAMVGLGNVTNLAASDYLTALSSGTTNAVSITVGGTTKNITVSTMKSSLGLKALAYKDSLVASDIPSLSWSKITSGKPTTLSGYGITDALPLSGGTLTGLLNIDSTTSDMLLKLSSKYADADGATRIAFYDANDKFQAYVMTGWGDLILSHRSFRQIGVGDAGIWCSTDNGKTRHTLIHSGNIGNQQVWRADRAERLINSDSTIGLQVLSGGKIKPSNQITFDEEGKYGIYRGNYYSSAGSEQDIAIYTPKLFLGEGGNVLIGTITDSGQKLQVNGDSYVNGSLTVSSSAKVNSLNVNDKASITNTGAINGTSLVMPDGGIQLYKNDESGEIYFSVDKSSCNTYIGGTLSADGAASFESTLKVTGATTLSDKLTISKNGMSVTGAAYFGGGTTYYFGSTGNVSANTLTAAGATSLKSTLAVTGTSTFTGNATFLNKIYLSDNVYIYWDSSYNAIRTNASFASDGTLSSLGVGSDGDGGVGSVIDLTHVVTNIVPSMDGLNLGTAASSWAVLYANSMNITDSVVFGTNSSVTAYGTFKAASIDGDLIPAVDGEYNIGSPTMGWDEIYANGVNASVITEAGLRVATKNWVENNYVTKSGYQTISGKKDFTGGIDIYGQLNGYLSDGEYRSWYIDHEGNGVFSSLKVGSESVALAKDIPSLEGYATQEFVTSQGYTSNVGTVTGVKVNGTNYSPSNGIVDLGTISGNVDLTGYAKLSSQNTFTAYNIFSNNVSVDGWISAYGGLDVYGKLTGFMSNDSDTWSIDGDTGAASFVKVTSSGSINSKSTTSGQTVQIGHNSTTSVLQCVANTTGQTGKPFLIQNSTGSGSLIRTTGAGDGSGIGGDMTLSCGDTVNNEVTGLWLCNKSVTPTKIAVLGPCLGTSMRTALDEYGSGVDIAGGLLAISSKETSYQNIHSAILDWDKSASTLYFKKLYKNDSGTWTTGAMNVDVSGNLSANSLDVTGVTTLSGKLSAEGGADIVGLMQGLDSVGGNTVWEITSGGKASFNSLLVTDSYGDGGILSYDNEHVPQLILKTTDFSTGSGLAGSRIIMSDLSVHVDGNMQISNYGIDSSSTDIYSTGISIYSHTGSENVYISSEGTSWIRGNIAFDDVAAESISVTSLECESLKVNNSTLATLITEALNTFNEENLGTAASKNWTGTHAEDTGSLVTTTWVEAKLAGYATTAVASTSANGLMSAAMVTKLNGIATGATAVTSSTVSGWGYTKNAGTVTSVAVKMNGSTKGTVTSSGTIDLGTVLTAHQSLAGYAKLSAQNTFTAHNSFNSSISVNGLLNANGGLDVYGFVRGFMSDTDSDTWSIDGDTGVATFSSVVCTSASTGITLYRGGGGTPYMRFGQNASTLYGEIGVNSSGNPMYWNYINGDTAWKEFITADNISNQTVLSSKRMYLNPATSGDLNTILAGGGAVRNYSNGLQIYTNAPSGASYGCVYELAVSAYSSLAGQLAWDVNHGSTSDTTKRLWWRAADSSGFVNAKWHQIAFMDEVLPSSGGEIQGSLGITSNLSVQGSINITYGGLTAPNGTVSAKTITQTSDERLKNLIGDVRLSLGAMACAPLKKFHYHDDGLLRVGTIAQYWQGALPEVVSTTPNGTLALAYGELGVAMGISLANHLTELKADLSVADDEVSKLKKRVEQLEAENKRLQERVDALVA